MICLEGCPIWIFFWNFRSTITRNRMILDLRWRDLSWSIDLNYIFDQSVSKDPFISFSFSRMICQERCIVLIFSEVSVPLEYEKEWPPNWDEGIFLGNLIERVFIFNCYQKIPSSQSFWSEWYVNKIGVPHYSLNILVSRMVNDS